mmetsp:Transcript_10722/g.22320  ORF Transcript_10722/g.22320 Transcript_10722/m.22320 type:complete len:206 (-) Transcript_10722:970-1587(-)
MRQHVALARQLRHHRLHCVADKRRLHVVVRVRQLAHRGHVQAPLVGESFGAHKGVRRRWGLVAQLRHRRRRGREQPQVLGVDCVVPHLHLQVPDNGEKVGVAGALAVPVDARLHQLGPRAHRDEGVGHCQARVVVAVHPDAHLWPVRHRLHRARRALLHHPGHGPAVGVAEHDGGCTRRRRRAQAHERILLPAVAAGQTPVVKVL